SWRVRSKNPGIMPSNWSNWSDRWNFTTTSITGKIGNNANIPKEFKLFDNYPNPFNPATTIKFDIPHALNVNLTVYDAIGRIVDVLLNRRLSAGSYEIPWNASMFASSIYYLRLEAGNFFSSKKMVLLK
ncbi:MAG: T9SS type A sorting domain-containing protein, partial [Ignavibacteria bacterium]